MSHMQSDNRGSKKMLEARLCTSKLQAEDLEQTVELSQQALDEICGGIDVSKWHCPFPVGIPVGIPVHHPFPVGIPVGIPIPLNES